MSRFHILHARTRFRRYGGRRVPISCFARSDSFSAVPRAYDPVFLFCAPGLVFGGTEGVGSRLHVLRVRTRFQQYRGRRVPFSYFAITDSFSAVPTASGPVFIFCALGLVFVGTEGVGSRFHVLRARTRFRRYRGSRVPFSCFARPNLFLAVPRAFDPVFLFYAPGLVFRGTEGVGSRFHILRPRTRFRRLEGVGSLFHVLRAQTRFRRYRGHRVPFSCFARPNLFLAVPRAFDPVFLFCAPGLIFGGTEGVGSHFNILRSRTRFRRYRGRRVLFSCFALPDSFSAVLSASGPVFMFCAPGLIFGGTEGVRFCFHNLCARPHFRRVVPRASDPVFMFWRTNSFSAVPRASGPVFMFCAPGLVFGGTEGVESRFNVLRARISFQRYRGCRIPFSCFALPDSSSAVCRA
jgi:hypothetical protein